MLTIGEFSNICKVSTKTLRYYAEIGLILPDEINPETGYRYYAIEQLQTMLFIERLKSYHFSLEEIGLLMKAEIEQDDLLYEALCKKEVELKKRVQIYEEALHQIKEDMEHVLQGKALMSYMDQYDIQLVDMSPMCLLSSRGLIKQDAFEQAYQAHFYSLFKQIQEQHLRVTAPPMVLFHSDEYTPAGLDTEFAIPVQEVVTGTRDFYPGLCLRTVLRGAYSNLPSVYAKQITWAEREGYVNAGPLFEFYVNNPSNEVKETELVTEVYYPVKKRLANKEKQL